jgi:hypothetical protein
MIAAGDGINGLANPIFRKVVVTIGREESPLDTRMPTERAS